MRHCWDVSAPPVIRRTGHCAALVTPLVWHFATNCAAVKFAEPWMSKHFSELREHNYVSSAMYPECSTKDWWGKSCLLNPRESDPNVVQGPGGVTSSQTLLGPVLVWTRRNIWNCCWSWGFPSPSRDVAPAGTGCFGLAVSVWAVSIWAVLVWAVSLWPFRCGDISVHKQLIAFVYLNDYIGRRNVTLASVIPTPFWEVMIAIKSELYYEF